jgi:hypothetical protein
MHPWRKLNIEWLSSSRLRKISNGAFRLWVMLLTAQDDDGYFELEDAKLAQLVAGTTTWNSERCKAFIDELEEAGLVVRDGNFIVLYRGSEFNGMLRPERPSSGFFYRSDGLRAQSIAQQTVSGGQLSVSGGLEERRGDSDMNEIQIREKLDSEENRESESEIEIEANVNSSVSTTVDLHQSNRAALREAFRKGCERDYGAVTVDLMQKFDRFNDEHPVLSVSEINTAFEIAHDSGAVGAVHVLSVIETRMQSGCTNE